MITKQQKIGLIALAVLAIGFFAFEAFLNFSAASAAARSPEFAARRALVTPEKGSVELRKAGTAAWIPIDRPTEIAQGDALRTGPGASATLDLFEQGQARLDENASATLSALSWDENSGRFVGHVLIESGRLWSRLLDFMSPESSYEVRTSHLVATVRGTAFFVGVSTASEDIYVDEHLVAVAPVTGGTSIDLPKGKRLRLPVSAAKTSQRAVAASWKIDTAADLANDAWVRDNREHDQELLEQIEQRIRSDVKRFAPTTLLSERIEGKERAHLGNADPERARVGQRGFSRLVAEAILAVDQGDQGRAKTLLIRAKRFCKEAGAGCRLDPRLMEAVAHHADFGAELNGMLLDLSPDLADVMNRVLARRAKFATAPSPAPAGGAAPARASGASEIPVGSTTASPAAPTPLRLEITAQRFTFGFGESGLFSAYVRWSDGRSEDVTERTQWSLASLPTDTSAFGSMRGNQFTAGRVSGEAKLTASYVGTDGTLVVTDTVRVVSKDETPN